MILVCSLVFASLPLWILLDVLRHLGMVLVCALKIPQLCFRLLPWYVCSFSLGADLDLSKNFGQYQSGQFFPPQTYDPSASYLLGECERLRRENANLNAALQLLK